jgi:Tol biopolymer transport system component/DNA-binding winged helix-turn-helix (wHTH) protein
MARPNPDVATANNDTGQRLCGWQVQPALNRVVKDGAEVRLEPRVMQVLACLLAAGGEPVTRDALMQQVWGHEHVTEDALNRTVSKLRRLITDELHCDAEIETIPKTGYRLVQPETMHSAQAAAAATSAGHALRRHWWWMGTLAAALVVAAVLWPRGPQSNQDVSTDWRAHFIPLTTLGGKEIEPTLSPDGSHVAFAWRPQPGGQYHIYVRPISSDSLLQITQGPLNDFGPAWSPIGDQIAYTRIEDGVSCEILGVSSVGGPVRHLADCDKDDGDALSWSPDGKVLAMKAPGSKGIDFMTLADSSIRHFTEIPPSEQEDNSPTFSPDGTLLAFVRWHAAGVGDEHVVPVSGGQPRRLTFDNLKVEGLTWEPDGRHLVYSTNRGGPFALWRVGTDGGPPEPVPLTGRTAYSPVMSRDGQRLVYEEWNGQTDLFSIDTRNPGVAPQQLTFTTRWDWNPSVSLDGKGLAFVSDRTGFSEIWVSDLDGGNALKLTAFGGPYTSGPAWSPDGRYIVFDNPAADGNFDVYEVNADGGTPRRLTTAPAEDRFAHFSPDGKWIYFSSRRSGDWEIWRMLAAGGDAEQVTFKGGYYSKLGPDGAVYFSRINHPGIWRVVPGGDPELVVPDLEEEDCSNWQPGPDRIWYVQRNARGVTSLASHSYKPGGPGQLFAPMKLLSYRSGISLTQDGRLVFAGVVRDESDLMLLQK